MTDPLSHQQIFAMEFAPDLLQGRTILVTGAGDGIGKIAAQTFAGLGANLILTGKTIPKLETTYDEILQSGGPQPVIFPIDFEGATEDHYDKLAEDIEGEMGGLDGVLFNASYLGARRPISTYYTADWDRCMQVNLRSQFLMIKALLPILERSTNGRMLFTSSGVGRKGSAHWGAYAVSKFATEGLMQVLADEMDGISSIGVNAINPGATRTRMRAQAYPAENPETLKTAEDIMPLYIYLISDLSNGVSGYSMDAQPPN